MAEFELPPAAATTAPAADVTAPPVDAGSVMHASYPVRQSEEEANEIVVPVRGTTLRRVRKRLSTLLSGTFPWSEVLLGAATLFLGASFGAYGSGVPWASLENGAAVANPRAILFYAALPIVGVGAAVGYFCLRHFSGRTASTVAQDSLDDLPDPDHTK